MTSNQIRQQFLDFFIQHGHTFVPSSPVVPHDDPTLLFTNAGMNQFKPIFLGQEKRAYTRAVNTQKCIRAGGKHNDLDDVGRSRRHHTFFEMLGNWSFGDYFKQGAIEMAWELLTQVWKLDPARLHVSCYEGNAAAGIPRDTEAADIWKQVAGLDDSHIHYFGKDNFWEMGDTGPCGPCTEIYIDRRPQSEIDADAKVGRRSPVNGEDPRVMEIWNNVFIQYNRDAAGKLTTLPAQHVDTGMGLERICQVLQAKDDNFATDLWSPLFAKITALCGKPYTGKFPPTNSVDPQAEAADEQLRHDIAFRVVADHVRCLTFALTDGAVPSNEGRGYVLRRILRRAVRFGRQQLGLTEPFMHTLVPVIVDSMGTAFPELKKNPQHVAELIRDEEVSFGKTLDRGIALFEEAALSTQHSALSTIPAGDAFKLHDTYGFPIDLTRIMAEERGMSVDIAGYEKLMEQAKELARAGGKDQGSKKLTELPPAALAQLAAAGVKPTDDTAKYGHDSVSAQLLAIWNGDDLGLSPASAAEDEELALILDRTNFYAEMGGQVGDTGTLTLSAASGRPASAGREGTFDVTATKAVAGYILHLGRLRTGTLQVGQTLTTRVAEQRERIERNHTATHLLNWSLRKHLGDGIAQKGSLVDPDKLRFDFSHGKSLAEPELRDVELDVIKAVGVEPLTVYIDEVPQEQALKINGLRAVFGEKYPPKVRVVSVGVPVADLLADPANPNWPNYSIEFCGGTHLAETREAGAFAIVGEESVSKGVRRIVAITGKPAMQAWSAAGKLMDAVTGAKAAPDAELPPLIAQISSQLSTATLPLGPKRQVQAALAELQVRAKSAGKKAASRGTAVDAAAIATALLSEALSLAGGKVVVGEIPGASDDQLRSAIDSLKAKSPTYAILLAAAGEKVTFIAAVSDDLVARGLKAGDWVRDTAKIAGGGGGGRPQMAQAGGKDPTKVSAALDQARALARTALG